MTVRISPATTRLLPASASPAVGGAPPAAPVAPAGVPRIPGIAELPAAGQAPGGLLDRSGVDPRALLGTEDTVVQREAVAGGELEVGLEQARGALVRQSPAETMAILDQVWEGAQGSEEGWYLRAGALLGIGRTADGDRVAADGLAMRPESAALRFARSLARAGTGDLGAARQLLEEAMALNPDQPLLEAQHAVLQARHGDADGAWDRVEAVASRHPDHPAVVYARLAMRAIRAEARRSAPGVDVPSPPPVPDTGAPAGAAAAAQGAVMAATLAAAQVAAQAAAHQGPVATAAPPLRDPERRDATDPEARGAATDAPLPDLVARLVRRVAVLLADGPPATALLETRRLLRAVGTRIPLTDDVTPAQEQALRALMAAVIDALADGPRARDEGDPLRRLVLQLVPTVQQRRDDEAARLLFRLQRTVSPLQLRLLEAFALGDRPLADRFPAGADPSPPEAPVTPAGGVEPATPAGEPLVSGAPWTERSPAGGGDLLLPVRLGLSLLEETAAMRAAARQQARAAEQDAVREALAAAERAAEQEADPDSARSANGEQPGAGDEAEGGAPPPLEPGMAIPTSLHWQDGRVVDFTARSPRTRPSVRRWHPPAEGEGRATQRAGLLFAAGAVVAAAIGFSGAGLALGVGAAFLAFGGGAGAPHSGSRNGRR
ncbi:MAG: hypothetical protein KJT01_03070 [Gemmatimonadetes bacterium]|nr:hypothetical protein [Gemmatimonadota bacterium]